MTGLFDNIDKALLKRFKEYHATNPHVYEEFKRLAFQAIKAGRKKYSAWVIINVMRWNHDIQTTGDEFKISNGYIGIYARLFIFHYPQHEGFFQLKNIG